MPSGAGGPAVGRRRLRLPLPCTIITGSLASGKTTAIAALLRAKPPGEVWAVLVNEFGAAGLDAALLEGGAAGTPLPAAPPSPPQQPVPAVATVAGGAETTGSSGGGGVHIRQLAGGCLCCALSSVAPLAVAQLLRGVKPDRLLIEPSGLAHPAALLDMLQGGHLAGSLALQPVVCLVDATQFVGGASSPAACEGSQLLMDQISIADVVVGSKADLCDSATLAAFRCWAEQLFPPKALVCTAAAGQLQDVSPEQLLSWAAGTEGSSSSSGWACGPGGAAAQPPVTAGPQQAALAEQLPLPVQRVRRMPAASPWLSSSAAGEKAAAGGGADPGARAATGGQPQRKQVQDASGAYAACGWIFPADCVFSRQRLEALLQLLVPHALRVKGVFRLSPKLWVAASAAPPRLPPPPVLAGATGSTARAAAQEAELAAAAAAAAAAPGAAAASTAIELREIAYRRDSRVEIIMNTEAAAAGASVAAAAAAAAGPGGGAEADEGGGGAAAAAGEGAAGPAAESQASNYGSDGLNSLAAQAACLTVGLPAGGSSSSGRLGVGDGGGDGELARRVKAALGSAAAGDWAPLEALLLSTVEGP